MPFCRCFIFSKVLAGSNVLETCHNPELSKWVFWVLNNLVGLFFGWKCIRKSFLHVLGNHPVFSFFQQEIKNIMWPPHGCDSSCGRQSLFRLQHHLRKQISSKGNVQLDVQLCRHDYRAALNIMTPKTKLHKTVPVRQMRHSMDHRARRLRSAL